MSCKLLLLTSLILFSQIVFALPIESYPDHFPPAVAVGRYVLFEDRYWLSQNKTVQELRDEGYDVPGDSEWPLEVNYTRLDYTVKTTIVKSSWPNITVQIIEGEHDRNITAHRIEEDGSIGEKLASFLVENQPHFPYMRTYESWYPEIGPVFDPSLFVIDNNFGGKLLEYTIKRTETLEDTPWGQNQTYIIYGYFANASHSIKTNIWCDAESGIILKQMWDSEFPTHISREEMIIVETGVKTDKFEVFFEEEVYEIPIKTDSTIEEFTFDPATKEIRLAVNGSTGTLGTCNITLPKQLVPTDHFIEVRIDGQKTDHELTEDEDNYYVQVGYQHSTHIISIHFVAVAIWMQWWFWLIVVVGFIILAGVVYSLKRRKPSYL